MLVVTAKSDDLPITLAAAREYLRAPTDDDADIERALKTAVDFAERKSSRAFTPKSFELRLDCWPCGRDIEIPMAPVRDVAAIKYFDEDGAEQTVSADDYSWSTTAEGATIRLKSDFSAPTLESDRKGAVVVEFDAGYDIEDATGAGDDPELVLPPAAQTAILMLTAHWYENREAAMTDQTFPVVLAANELLGQLRIFR